MYFSTALWRSTYCKHLSRFGKKHNDVGWSMVQQGQTHHEHLSETTNRLTQPAIS